MIRFQYHVQPTIPQLAWCATLTQGCDEVEVLCGRAVECREGFFVSGVWDGAFEEAGFDACAFACCSGAKLQKISGGGVILSTPQTLLETVYSVRVGERLSFSNSLPMLLEVTGSGLDPNHLRYQEALCSGLFGTEGCVREAPLAGGRTLRLYRGENISVDSSLDVRTEWKDSGLEFDTFGQYKEAVVGVLKRLKDNASSPQRKSRYENLVTSISRGYDATATSALVRSIGCERVITFDRPVSYADDEGSAIAERLGYRQIIKGDADLYLRNTERLEALNCATGEAGAPVFAAWYKEMENGLFFMGTRGDSVWERLHGNVNNRQDFSLGNSLMRADIPFVETALEHNIVIVPVPMIGCDRWESLSRISNSEEMKPWSVGDHYDRPIARRLVEELGVGREEFGQKKKGAGLSYHLDTLKRLEKRMSPASYMSLLDFNKRLKRNRAKLWVYKMRYFCKNSRPYFVFLFKKLHVPIRLKGKTCYDASPISSLLLLWGVEVARQRYKCKLI